MASMPDYGHIPLSLKMIHTRTMPGSDVTVKYNELKITYLQSN